MNENRNRRLISGHRVVCKCSLDLPKQDPFSGMKVHRKGYFVLNVRGGSLYLNQQMNRQTADKIFPEGKSSVVKNLTVYPENAAEIIIGDIGVRFLRLAEGKRAVGLVLRFVNPTEKQMDILNQLLTIFPVAQEDEELSIPHTQLSKM